MFSLFAALSSVFIAGCETLPNAPLRSPVSVAHATHGENAANSCNERELTAPEDFPPDADTSADKKVAAVQHSITLIWQNDQRASGAEMGLNSVEQGLAGMVQQLCG